VKNGALKFPAGASGYISVFCMGADCAGITLQGLKYPMTDGSLTAGFPLGVSNQFTGERASVAVKAGSLLVIYDRSNGFARREEL
jgi:thiamine pyrophosphokinase